MKIRINRKITLTFFILFFVLNIYLISQIYEYSTISKGKILNVEFLNIGQGDSILITTPNQLKILIDTSQGDIVTRELSKSLSYFNKKIDIILATHADMDHIGGIPFIIDKYQIDYFVFNFDLNTSGVTREISRRLKNTDISQISVSAGDRIYLDRVNDIYLDILWSHPEYKNDNKNENSIVAILNYEEISFMLTGDIGKEVEGFLLNIFDSEKLKSNVLKLGHHGSKNSSTESFVKSVSPEYAVVSAGEDNKFGHPHIEVIGTLDKLENEVKILETKNGPVIFQTDGRNLWVN